MSIIQALRAQSETKQGHSIEIKLRNHSLKLLTVLLVLCEFIYLNNNNYNNIHYANNIIASFKWYIL